MLADSHEVGVHLLSGDVKGAMRELGRVRWKRFALIFVPATAVASLLFVATVQGAIGASFVVSGQTIKSSADLIRAWGVSEFGGVVETKDGKKIPVYITTNRRSEAVGTCTSYLLRTPIGTATVRATAGTPERPVRAENQVFFAVRQAGDLEYTNIQTGRDASTLNTVPGAHGQEGSPGAYASTIVVHNARQLQIATSAEAVSVPGSSVRVLFGVHECF